MSRPVQKGKAGENEACEWIRKHIFKGLREVKRNREQVELGCDIICKPFIFEIKRREKLALGKWWIQISIVQKYLRSFNKEYIPVVMYRQNKGNWEFLISTEALGITTGGYIHISAVTFIEWAVKYV